MGLSASQGRLLTLTSRMSDLEKRSESISNQKMRLTASSTNASRNYQQALQMENIKFDNGLSTVEATASNLTEFNPNLTTQRFLKTSDNKLVVDSKVASAFASSSSCEMFLNEMGYTSTSWINSANNMASAFSAASTTTSNTLKDALENLVQTQANNGDKANLSTSLKALIANGYEVDDSSRALFNLNYSDAALANALYGNGGSLDNRAETRLVGIEHNDSNQDDVQVNVGNALTNDILNGDFKSKLTSTAGGYINNAAYSAAMDKTFNYYMSQIGSTQMNSGYLAVSNNTGSSSSSCDDGQTISGPYASVFISHLTDGYGVGSQVADAMYDGGTATNELVNSLNRQDEFWVDKNQVYKTFVNNYEAALNAAANGSNSTARSNTSISQTTTTATRGAAGNYYDTQMKNATNAISLNTSSDVYALNSSNTIENVVNNYMQKLDDHSKYLMGNPGFAASYQVLKGFSSSDLASLNATEMLTFINQINNMSAIISNGANYQNVNNLNDDPSKVRYYTNVYNEMKNNGGYAEVGNDNLKSTDWLYKNLTSGNVYLANKSFTEDTSTLATRYDYRSDDKCLSVESDKTYIAQAEAEYNSVTAEIEAKEKRLDAELNTNNTEYSAVQNEIDSVKKVMDKNTERSFKLFG